jgi:alkylhydroperoxidase family enzyme
VLLRVYEDADVVRLIAEDPDNAPIPDTHKAVYRWTGKLVHEPWSLGADDIGMLRGMGLADREITQWVVRAASQSWFTMCADGAGVDLDGGMLAGPAVGREREVYKAEVRPQRGADDAPEMEAGSCERRSQVAWVETNEQGAAFEAAAAHAQARWGCVPNILRAVSSLPETLERHSYMMELLERPQSETLSPRTHALIRAEVARINRSTWSKATIDTLLARHGESNSPAVDEMAVDLARKLVSTPWKVTAREAAAFRDAGLDDSAYLDALNTTAIQNALDRLCWALGVRDDEGPLLER